MSQEIAKTGQIMQKMFIYENDKYGKWKLVSYLITLNFEDLQSAKNQKALSEMSIQKKNILFRIKTGNKTTFLGETDR